MTAPAFRDDFDGPGLDGEVWVAHYLWGWTPLYGVIEARARMELSPRSMAAVWMVGVD